MKRLKVFYVIFLILGVFRLHAQSQDDVTNSMTYKVEKAVYNRAIKYNDAGIAVNALYRLCVLQPRNDSLLYALQYLYFNSQDYISSILVANDVLLLNPKNTGSQEMKAMSLERVGAKDKAIDEYESLYLKNNSNITYLYKTALLEYEVKRYKESLTNVNILLKQNQADTLKLTFDKNDSVQIQVPMKASLYNVKGMLNEALNNDTGAKVDYDSALMIAPDFFLPKQNLDSLKVKMK